MSGVPGQPGHVPKRSSQRRRTNGPAVDLAVGADVVEIPGADPEWETPARLWYESLAKSGQSTYYEPSDWAAAYVLAESISREMGTQPIVVGTGKDAVVEMHRLPPKGASLSAWLKGMGSLMVTEGDRRRVRLELERAVSAEGEEEADVSEIAIYRRRLQSG